MNANKIIFIYCKQ